MSSTTQRCYCQKCQYRQCNSADIEMRSLRFKPYASHQFVFDLSDTRKHMGQISTVQCDSISRLLHTNGILQQKIYDECLRKVYRKCGKEVTSQAKKRRRMAQLVKAPTWPFPNLKKSNRRPSLQSQNTTIGCNSLSLRPAKEFVSLPLVDRTDDGCSMISGDTLVGVMSGQFQHLFDYYVIVDCRYEYEYSAGHIRGAISVQDKLLLEKLYKANTENRNVAWIFLCEFSKHRGPQTCRYFRELDRKENAMNYPHLSFPHRYVLQGGYKEFWSTYHRGSFHLFYPIGFTSMWTRAFDETRCVHSQFRHATWNKRSKKSRKRPRRKVMAPFAFNDNDLNMMPSASIQIV